MSDLLDQAFREVSRLPEAEQRAIAAWLLEELATERRWAAAFRDSQNALAALADAALAEHRQGRTADLDPETL